MRGRNKGGHQKCGKYCSGTEADKRRTRKKLGQMRRRNKGGHQKCGKYCSGTDTPRLAFKIIKAEGVGVCPDRRPGPGNGLRTNIVVRVCFQTGCPPHVCANGLSRFLKILIKGVVRRHKLNKRVACDFSEVVVTVNQGVLGSNPRLSSTFLST